LQVRLTNAREVQELVRLNYLHDPQELLRETQDKRVQLEDMLRRAEEQQQQVRGLVLVRAANCEA